MSWIKDNTFLVVLGGITAVGAGGLFYAGHLGGAKFDAAKEQFDAATQEVSTFESFKPYPTQDNRNAKKTAIEAYRKEIGSLQDAFNPFRPGELKEVSPEEFIDRLKKTNIEVREAFKREAVEVPDAFFVGFKDYAGRFPSKSTTGILGYQLEAIRELMMAFAHSGATEITNLYRPLLPEEQGQAFKPAPDAVYRELPLEISFQGTEQAVRSFVSTLSKPDHRYWVIRSIRIANEKKDPPKKTDAKFEQAGAGPKADAGVSFDDIFAVPEGEKPKEGEAAAPAPPPTTGDNRILALILGSEQVHVCIRLDLLMFLPPAKLP